MSSAGEQRSTVGSAAPDRRGGAEGRSFECDEA